MMEILKREKLQDLFQEIADMMADRQEELCEMDAMMGDGDLGLTMKKGFGELPAFIAGLQEESLGKLISKCGMRLSSVIPSTMGFLMGSGLMSGGKAIGDVKDLDAAAYVRFLRGYAEGIVLRGKCAPGDRTVLDSIDKGAAFAEAALQENPELSFAEAALKAYEGAQAGLEATKHMEPKFGKAAVHKAKAKGVEDQGAKAGMYVLKAIYVYTTK